MKNDKYKYLYSTRVDTCTDIRKDSFLVWKGNSVAQQKKKHTLGTYRPPVVDAAPNRATRSLLSRSKDETRAL